jgi:hypothetical protein
MTLHTPLVTVAVCDLEAYSAEDGGGVALDGGAELKT